MNRSRPVLLALSAAILIAPQASAAEIRCERDIPCLGTPVNDVMFGTITGDVMRAQDGSDMLTGRAGHDRMKGNSGEDELRGGKGADVLRAGPVEDTPGEFGDILWGGRGPDELHGGTSDVLVGGRGDDTLYGSGDGQTFWLDEGNDATFGRGGRDRFIIVIVAWGKDTLSASKDHDDFMEISQSKTFEPLRINLNSRDDRHEVKQLRGSATLDWSDDAIQSIFVEAGRDRIRGSEDPDQIHSHGGKDTIFGGGGDDEINTSNDNGADTIDCGAGDADEVTYDAEDTVTNCEILHPVD